MEINRICTIRRSRKRWIVLAWKPSKAMAWNFPKMLWGWKMKSFRPRNRSCEDWGLITGQLVLSLNTTLDKSSCVVGLGNSFISEREFQNLMPLKFFFFFFSINYYNQCSSPVSYTLEFSKGVRETWVGMNCTPPLSAFDFA